jgi:hypothetical protein
LRIGEQLNFTIAEGRGREAKKEGRGRDPDVRDRRRVERGARSQEPGGGGFGGDGKNGEIKCCCSAGGAGGT